MLQRNSDRLRTIDDARHAKPDPSQDQNGGGLLDFRTLWLILRRRSGVIAGAIILTILCAVVALMLIKPTYTATTVVLVDPRQQRVMSAEAVLSGIGSDAAAVESQVEVIGSVSLAQRVIRKLGLADDPEFASPSALSRVLGTALGQLGLGRTGAAVTDEEAFNRTVTRFQEHLKVKRRGLTYVLEISVWSEDAGKAARIANAIADGYLIDQLDAKYDATRRASSWLSARIEELRDRVGQAERAVETFKAENNLVNVGGGEMLNERQIAELNQQLILARARTAEAQAKFEQVQQVSRRGGASGSIAEALQSQVITSLRTQHAEVARREAELSVRYGAQHPSVMTVRAQLGDIRRQIDDEIGRILAGVKNEYEVARSREDSLESSLGDLKRESAASNQAVVKLRELEREAQANRTLFEQLLSRFKETSEQQSLQVPDARVIAPAVMPTRPSHPKTVLILVMALVGSVAVGVGLAFLLEHLDSGFRTVDQVEGTLDLPAHAILPMIKAGSNSLGRLGGTVSGWLAVLTPGRGDDERRKAWLAANNPQAAMLRHVVDHPLSQFAEGIRALRMGLQYSDEAANARVLLVASSLPNEGKSTTAMNLAHYIAGTGQKVLLVDGDLRNPSLTHAYAPSATRGLIELINGDVQLDDVVVKDAETGLAFLPGPRKHGFMTTAEVLASERAGKTLDSLREAFDMVIIDGAPLIPVVDSRGLLEHVDAAVLVVEWERTGRDAVHTALASLGRSAAKIAGVVLTKARAKRLRYYDYYRSGHYGSAYGYYRS